MGTWSEATFGNDTACDWLASFLERPGIEPLRLTLQAVLESKGILESSLACNGLAACEVIARLKGSPGESDFYTEELDRWIDQTDLSIPDDLKVIAVAVIDRILGPDSELVELWDDDGWNEEWHNIIKNLRNSVIE